MANNFCESKISNFEIPIMNQYVLRLNISMNEIMIVENFVALAELLQEKPNFFFSYFVIGIKHILIEIAPIAVFHNQVKVVLT